MQIKNKIFTLLMSWEIPKKTKTENIVRYNKLNPWIDDLKKIDLKFFFLIIFEIKPLNSIQEIKETKIKEIIKIYEYSNDKYNKTIRKIEVRILDLKSLIFIYYQSFF
jgi:hypothetical protein